MNRIVFLQTRVSHDGPIIPANFPQFISSNSQGFDIRFLRQIANTKHWEGLVTCHETYLPCHECLKQANSDYTTDGRSQYRDSLFCIGCPGPESRTVVFDNTPKAAIHYYCTEHSHIPLNKHGQHTDGSEVEFHEVFPEMLEQWLADTAVSV